MRGRLLQPCARRGVALGHVAYASYRSETRTTVIRPRRSPASHEVRGDEVVVAGGVHVDVDMRGPADLARRDRALEPKCASRACGDACVAAPVVAAVPTSLPELDQRPTDRCATRIAQDPAGENVAVSDPRASRCYGGIRLERPTTGRYARPTHGDGWRRRSGGHQNSCAYEHDCEHGPACQRVHREQSTLSRTTIPALGFQGEWCLRPLWVWDGLG